ncbi:hypothetical protein Mapa_001980 [Marchantia paleacea]|nr:hypothetical protein Mapa_001980 [Marchantia paleacea]
MVIPPSGGEEPIALRKNCILSKLHIPVRDLAELWIIRTLCRMETCDLSTVQPNPRRQSAVGKTWWSSTHRVRRLSMQ